MTIPDHMIGTLSSHVFHTWLEEQTKQDFKKKSPCTYYAMITKIYNSMNVNLLLFAIKLNKIHNFVKTFIFF